MSGRAPGPFGLEGPWDVEAPRSGRREPDPSRGLLIAVAATCAAGALVLANSPRLRRLTWQLTRAALTTYLPAYLAREFRAAWQASAPPEPNA